MSAQIDLVIDRSDHVINLFEIKFYNQPFVVKKDYAVQIRKKMEVFRRVTKTKKQLFYLLISTFGMKTNQHSLGLIVKDLQLTDLFRQME